MNGCCLLCLQTSGDPVQEMQKQVEIKLANNNGSPELYAAMAESLAAAWRDVRSLLADRQNLLILNVNYHRYMQNQVVSCNKIKRRRNPHHEKVTRDYSVTKGANVKKRSRARPLE